MTTERGLVSIELDAGGMCYRVGNDDSVIFRLVAMVKITVVEGWQPLF